MPGNHRLLWHGTKTANMLGILQQGLRIAPPEASRSGWSLGKVCSSMYENAILKGTLGCVLYLQDNLQRDTSLGKTLNHVKLNSFIYKSMACKAT